MWTALIPWPYRAIAALILVAALCALGYYAGYTRAGDACLAAQAKALTAANKQARAITKATNKIEQQRISKRQDIARDHAKVQDQLAQNAALPDVGRGLPAECELAPERVRNINTAWGLEPHANTASDVNRVPGTHAPAERTAPNDRGVGDSTGPRLPGLRSGQGSTQPSGEAETKTNGAGR